jgi:hypothetical protein
MPEKIKDSGDANETLFAVKVYRMPSCWVRGRRCLFYIINIQIFLYMEGGEPAEGYGPWAILSKRLPKEGKKHPYPVAYILHTLHGLDILY